MVIEVKSNGYTFYYYPKQTLAEITNVFDVVFGYPEVDCPEGSEG